MAQDIIKKVYDAQAKIDDLQVALDAAIARHDMKAVDDIYPHLNGWKAVLADRLAAARLVYPLDIKKVKDAAPSAVQCHCGKFSVPHYIHAF